MFAQDTTLGNPPLLHDRASALLAHARTAATQGTAVHDVERGLRQRLLQLGHTTLVHFLALQGTGDTGATVTPSEGQTRARLPQPHAAFSPDGKLLASGSADHTVKLWDVAECKKLRTLQGHESAASSVAFSPDGRRLASVGWDQAVKLWDLAEGEEVLTLRGHRDAVTGVVFGKDDAFLAPSSADATVNIWDASR